MIKPRLFNPPKGLEGHLCPGVNILGTDNIGVDDSRCCRKANKYEGLRMRFCIYFQNWRLWSPNLIYKERPSFQVHRFGEIFQKLAIFRNFSYRVGATRQSFYSFISVVVDIVESISGLLFGHFSATKG